MKILYLVLVSLTLSNWATAQYSVSGRLLNESQESIAYAAVGLHSEKDSSIVKGSVSDGKGAFQISNINEGAYFLRVQYVGYQQTNSEKFVLSSQNLSVNIGSLVLKEDVQTLSEVTVTAQRPLVEHLPDRLVLNVENSVITKGNMVVDLLQYAPLVNVDVNGAVKVANNGNVLILVDGRDMGRSALDNFLKNYSAEDILKVEVITNPSAKYDASFKSVINIVTKKSLERGLKGRSSLSYSQGTAGRTIPNTSLNYRSDKWNLFGSVNYRWTNFYREQSLERFYPDNSGLNNENERRDKDKSFSTFTGIDFFPTKNQVVGIRLNGNWAKDRANETTLSLFQDAAGAPNGDDILTDNASKSNRHSYDINFNYVNKFDNTGKELAVNVTQTFLNQESFQDISYGEISSESEASGNPTILRITNPYEQQSLISQADFTLPISKTKLEFGAKYMYVGNDNKLLQETLADGTYQTDPEFSLSDKYEEYTLAAYTNYSSTLLEHWNVQAGLRAEHSQQKLMESDIMRDYFGLFPSVGINRVVGKGKSFSVSYSRKIMRPRLGELVPYRYIVDLYSIVEGNPNLRPQFSNSFDGYLVFGKLTFFANYTRTTDSNIPIIVVDPDTKIYTQYTGNIDLFHNAYAGLNLSADITKWWQTNSNLMVLRSAVNTQVEEIAGYKLSSTGAILNTTNFFLLPKFWKAEFSFYYTSPYQYSILKSGAQYWVAVGLNKEVIKNGYMRLTFNDMFRTRREIFSANYGAVNLSSRSYNDSQRVIIAFSCSFGRKTVKDERRNSLGNEDVKGRMGKD